MVRIYERLAGMSACLAMLAALAGLAAIPQTASAVVAPPCTGTCTVICSVATNSCSNLTANNCSKTCTVCTSLQLKVNGICVSCNPNSCN